MKILHLLYESKGDHFGIGGVGMRAYEIYKYLRNRHDITLLCKRYPGARDREIDGLRHIFAGTESMNFTKTLLSYAFHSAKFVKQNGNDFDIIIEEFSPAIPTFLHAFTQKPLILQVQGYTGRLYLKKYNPFFASVLFALELLRPVFYDNFIFISPETGQRLLPGDKKCIVIIPNGVSPELLTVKPGEGDYILYLGRIDIYGKGLDILLKAYKEFNRSFPGIRLVIAGDGKDSERFKAMLHELPGEVMRNIELLGWVSGERKEETLRNALFVVFPSRHEVQPITLLEAMASGKAVVVSYIPEFSFVIKGGAGTLFRSGDVLSLAESLKELAGRNELSEMGQRGRNLVRDYTWDKIALQYEEFLTQVIHEFLC